MQNSCKHPLRIIYIAFFFLNQPAQGEEAERDKLSTFQALFPDRIYPNQFYHLQNVQLVPRYRSAKLEKAKYQQVVPYLRPHSISIIYRCLSMIDPQTQKSTVCGNSPFFAFPLFRFISLLDKSPSNKTLRVNSGNTR